jgi:hypothetical protein
MGSFLDCLFDDAGRAALVLALRGNQNENQKPRTQGQNRPKSTSLKIKNPTPSPQLGPSVGLPSPLFQKKKKGGR